MPASATPLLGALCLLFMPAVLAQDCAAYMDTSLTYHPKQICILSFCCGTCMNRYCSINPFDKLDQSQALCIINSLWMFIGGSITLSLIGVIGLIACFCRCCCSLYQVYCKPSQETAVTTMTVTNHMPPPQQHMVPMAHTMAMPHPGYQPIPHQFVPGDPANKTNLPPPYPSEATDKYGYRAM
ncbi:protein shisa-4-like [Ascaphus truei]|uniref:protein shisa-4-like n=1 Tax=Ascaphus truei TaxID=8439 RepID=UPI003F592298